jgi:hypothetical protein
MVICGQYIWFVRTTEVGTPSVAAYLALPLAANCTPSNLLRVSTNCFITTAERYLCLRLSIRAETNRFTVDSSMSIKYFK